MFDSTTVANRFLELAMEKGDSLTPMQILKLVYIAHGWMLGLYGRPLIRDEIQAWQYGPVIPKLYSAVSKFRSQPVEGPLPGRAEFPIDVQASSIIKQVYDIYGHLSGPALSRLTHVEGSPWASSYVEKQFGIPIPNDMIEDYYSRLALADEAADGGAKR